MKYSLPNILVVLVGSTALTVCAQNYGGAQSTGPAQNPQAPPVAQQNSGPSVSFNQLPQPVQQTITEHAGNASIEDVRQVSQNGQQYYTATFQRGTVSGQISVASDGSLISLQETGTSPVGIQLPQLATNKIEFTQLPQPVQNTIALYAGNSPVGNLSQAQLNDQAVYRAEFEQAGIRHELFIAPNGQVAAHIQETASALAPMQNVRPMALKDVPQSVQRSVMQRAHVGNVQDVDRANWNGQTVYSVVVDNHGRLSQYVFDQNGKVLSEPGLPISEAAGAQPNHSNEPKTDAQHDHHILQQPK